MHVSAGCASVVRGQVTYLTLLQACFLVEPCVTNVPSWHFYELPSHQPMEERLILIILTLRRHNLAHKVIHRAVVANDRSCHSPLGTTGGACTRDTRTCSVTTKGNVVVHGHSGSSTWWRSKVQQPQQGVISHSDGLLLANG